MYRHCDVCRQVDEGPRHCFRIGPLEPQFPLDEALLLEVLGGNYPAEDKVLMLSDIQNTSDQTRHMECCAAAGCPALGTEADCNLRVV